jgi:hypothetical protein
VHSDWGNITAGKCSCNSDGQLVGVGTFHQQNDDDFYIVLQDIEFGEVITNYNITSPLRNSALGINHLIDNRMAVVGWGEFIYFEGIDGFGAVRDENGFNISIEFTIGFGFTGTDRMYDCFGTSDGGYVAIGESNSYGNNYQLLLAKVGSDGSATQENEDFLDLATPTRQEASQDKILLYPIPTNDLLKIETNSQIISYSLATLEGSVLIEENDLQKNPEKIDLTGFDQGIYLLRILYSDGSTSTHKVIKY